MLFCTAGDYQNFSEKNLKLRFQGFLCSKKSWISRKFLLVTFWDLNQNIFAIKYNSEFYLNCFLSRKKIGILVFKLSTLQNGKNIVPGTNAFLLRPRPFAFYPHSDCRPVAFFFCIKCLWVRSKQRPSDDSGSRMECGWNANGRGRKRNAFVPGTIFLLYFFNWISIKIKFEFL